MTTKAVVDDRQHMKRRNTTITVTFAAVVCIVAVVLAVNSLSRIGEGSEDPFGDLGSPPASAPQAPSTTPAPPAEGEAPPPPEAAPETSFSSPTGNIGCVISTQLARCDIAERDWDPGPAPASCKKTWGQGLALIRDGDVLVTCSGGTPLGATTVLQYGRSVTKGTFTCASSQAGMRCANTATGKGFSISRKTYTFF